MILTMGSRYRNFLFCFFSVVLTACSNGESRTEEGNRLGHYHIGIGGEPATLDPHVATGVPSAKVFWAIYEGLVVSNPYTLEPEPGVAERWEVSEDGLVYRFFLRENARWSNGDPVTAEDFHYTYQRALNPLMGHEYAYMLFSIRNAEEFLNGEVTDFNDVGIRVVDPFTLDIELQAPTPYFLQLLAHTSSSPVHRETIEKYGSPTARYSLWTRPENIVTNGPFQIRDWQISREVIVEKNPYYWDIDAVSLNQISFYPTENISTEERMFRVGQLHETNEIPLDKIPVYREENPEALQINPYIGSYYYQVNMTRAPFDDVRVRRALAMSIDRDSIISTVMNGVNKPSYTMTPPGMLGYQPPKVFGFDPEAARKLLAEAGFPDGVGFPKFEILYNTHESHRKIAVAIQQMWNKYLNIEVAMTNQEWKVYLNSRDTRDYDIARAGWIGDYVDPINFLDMGMSTNGNNDTGFADEHYDYLVTDYLQQAGSPEERLERFYEAEEYLMTAMPYIPVYTYQTKYLLQPGVRGHPANIRDYKSFKHISLDNR